MCVFVCTVCVSSTSDIGFTSSAKDIDQYFKTELNAEDSLPLKSELILPNGLCKCGERALYRNLIATVVGFEPNLHKNYDEFSTRPENTLSYVLNRSAYIITNIFSYIFTVVGCFICSM